MMALQRVNKRIANEKRRDKIKHIKMKARAKVTALNQRNQQQAMR